MKIFRVLLASFFVISFAANKFNYGAGLNLNQDYISKTTDSVEWFSHTSQTKYGCFIFGANSFVDFPYHLYDRIYGQLQFDVGYDFLNSTLNSYNYKFNSITGASSFVVKSGFYYGAKMKFMYSSDEYSPYLLIGGRMSNWSIDEKRTVLDSNNPSYPDLSHNISKNLFSPVVGAGIQFSISKEISSRIEYGYLWSNGISSNVQPLNNESLKANTNTMIDQHYLQLSFVL